MNGKCLDQSFLRALGGSLGAAPTHSHPKAGPCLGVRCMPLDTVMRGVAWAAGGVQGQAGALNSGIRCNWGEQRSYWVLKVTGEFF